MFADMERVKKFVPTLKKTIEVYGVENTLLALEDMINDGGYSTLSEVQQVLERDLNELENDKQEVYNMKKIVIAKVNDKGLIAGNTYEVLETSVGYYKVKLDNGCVAYREEWLFAETDKRR